MKTITVAFFDKLGMDMVQLTIEHVYLTFLAILLAILIAVPLGIYLTRTRNEKIVSLILGAAGVIQTVPALALIAFIVLFFALANLQTIGFLPGLVALVLYALLPILRNTYTGIRQIDPAVRDVAVGMGMRPRQILMQVELPLALPVIMAGVRIATVWTIGIATLCGLIGAGGLGDLIFRGLRSLPRTADYLLAGTIPAAILALIADGFLGWVENALNPQGARKENVSNEQARAKKRHAQWAIVGLMVVMVGLVGFKSYQGIAGERQVIRPAFDAEFFTRPDGYPGLSEKYGFEFVRKPRQMDVGLMYKALADETVDVIDGYATDGRIPAFGLMILEDDKNYFPPYFAAPVLRMDTLDAFPDLAPTLNLLGGRLSDKKMQELNYKSDEKGMKAKDIAREFLISEGLIGPEDEPGTGQAGTVVIGSKPFTEQEILGEIMSLLIEMKTDIAVDRKLTLGGTMICFNALKSGDLDLYAEYTGTGLVNILDEGVINDPDEAYAYVKEAFQKRYDLMWLEPFGFNNTYTLTMRRDHAEELGIETISDLADYVNRH